MLFVLIIRHSHSEFNDFCTKALRYAKVFAGFAIPRSVWNFNAKCGELR